MLISCAPRESAVTVVLEWDGAPLAGVEVLALPYDRRALLDSLSAQAHTPRPEFPDLEAELDTFERRDLSGMGTMGVEWAALRDTVAALADSLTRAGRDAPGYAQAHARFRSLYGRLLEQTARAEAGFRQATAPERRLATEAQRFADSLRAWETAAWAAYPELREALLAETGRTAVSARTDSNGGAALRLPSGEWWVEIATTHPTNPFRERVWYVPLVTGWGLPVNLPLDQRLANVPWRY